MSSSANAGGVSGSPATGTIVNDDNQPTISINDRSVQESNSSFFDLFFNITLSNPTDETVTVQVDTADGTATTADNDYVGVSSRTVTFNPGVTLQQTPVRINGDTKFEADQTFFVNLTNATNAASIADDQGQGTIQNDDNRPTISLVPVALATEGNSGFVDRPVTIELSNASDEVIDVAIVALDLTSVALLDYSFGGPGNLTFSPGDSLSQTVTVRINGDTLFERDEQFRLQLQYPQNATLGTGQIDIGILNDDAAPELAVTGGSVLEGNVAADGRQVPYTLSLSAASGVDVVGTLTTSSGTATEGTDFDSLDGTPFLIPAGTQQIIVTVPVIEDTNFETNETLDLTATVPDATTVSNADGATSGVGSILNDDVSGPPALSPAIVKDDGDSVYRERGLWNSDTGGFLGDIRFVPAGLGTKSATWKLPVSPGTYEIFATWTTGADRATNAPYTIFDGATSKATARPNQQLVPDDGTFGGKTWKKLGEYSFTSSVIVIQLSDAADGVVVADGVMAVLNRGEGEWSPLPASFTWGGSDNLGSLAALVSLDVNNDNYVSSSDALVVINNINAGVTQGIGPSGLGGSASVDVNSDGYISPLDALLVINHLNAASARSLAEAEATDAYFENFGSGDLATENLLLDLVLSDSLRSRQKRR